MALWGITRMSLAEYTPGRARDSGPRTEGPATHSLRFERSHFDENRYFTSDCAIRLSAPFLMIWGPFDG
jgi:hypothetical protein